MEHGQCRYILQRSIHDGCGPRGCSTHGLPLHMSRRPSQSSVQEKQWSNYPWPPYLPLTIPHLQDTNSVVGPGSSSPNSEFSSVGENRTHHPHPSSSSPTQQGLYSPGNLIQLLPWLCPIYPANWVQNTQGREHFSCQATSGHLRKRASWPIWRSPSAVMKSNYCPKELAHG